MKLNYSKGTTTVEFAIVGALLFIMIFGVFEVGRGYYVYSMLDEVTRRGARLAAVCPINDPAISRRAIFNGSNDSSTSSLVGGLAPGHVVIDYLDRSSNVIVAPNNPQNFANIRFVRARVVGYEHQINVPFVAGMTSVVMPAFESILPRESLGIPREGVVRRC